MPQYACIVYSPAPADPMSLSEEYVSRLDDYPARVAELGGELVTGFALQPSTTAQFAHAGRTDAGPAPVEGGLVVAGYYVLMAPDDATAARIAALNPATDDGGVEVRPLFAAPE